jgi:hypothetical protein
MNANVALLLVYQPDGGRPLTVARVDDQRMVLDVARSAILYADERAQELASVDRILGQIEWSEAGRLRKVLGLLVPGLQVGESNQRLVAQAVQ